MRSRVILKTQCKAPTGAIGSFLIDVNRDQLISPVCADLVEVFRWALANGWKEDPSTGRPLLREWVKE